VQQQQIHYSATLAHGDLVSICGHEFTFEIQNSASSHKDPDPCGF
jgi:hypothetical protein